MVLEEIRSISSSRRDLRNFGLVVGAGFILIGLLLLWRGKAPWPWFLGAGTLLPLLGLTFPALLKPIQKAWMTLAVLMGWVMTRVILSLLFYLLLTPLGLAARLFGKSFLGDPPPGPADSYWNLREESPVSPKSYEKQF
jgi:hypothetical protein